MFSSIINDSKSNNSDLQSNPKPNFDDSDPDGGIVMESDLIFIGSPPPSPGSSQNEVDDNCFFESIHERQTRITEAFEIQANDDRSIVANYDEEKVDQNFEKIVDEIEEELAKSSSSPSSELSTSPQTEKKRHSFNRRRCSCKIRCKCPCHDERQLKVASTGYSSTNSSQSVSGSFQNQRKCSPVNLEWDVSLDIVEDSSSPPKKYNPFLDSTKSKRTGEMVSKFKRENVGFILLI